MEEFEMETFEVLKNNAYVVDEVIHKAYKYVIDEDFEQPSQVRELVKLLDSLSENDTLYLTINHYGGCKFTLISVIDAIQNTRGYVIAQVIHASSAGSLVALSCHDVMMSKYGEWYIHEVQSGHFGDASLQKSRIDFLSRTQKTLFDDIYIGFLTKDEIDSLCNGTVREFNIDHIEAETRLESWRNYKEKQLEQEVEPDYEVEEVQLKTSKKDKKERGD